MPKLLSFALSLLGFFGLPAQAEVCRVAVAANFSAPVKQLLPLFEQLHQQKHQASIVTASTGQLYIQIQNGAPLDVFLAADAERPAALIEAGLALADSRFTYALGQLVIWRPGSGEITPDDLLSQSGQEKIAAANPKIAPYGAATIEALKNLGLSKSLRSRLVYGEDVNQALQFVTSGNAVAGFVSLAQVLAQAPDQRGVWWPVPASAHRPIAQQAVLLSRGKTNTCAIDFIAFLRTDDARDRIRQMGYGLTNEL